MKMMMMMMMMILYFYNFIFNCSMYWDDGTITDIFHSYYVKWWLVGNSTYMLDGCGRTIPWELEHYHSCFMSWLVSLPGQYQPWYWLWRIKRSLSFTISDFNYLCHSLHPKLMENANMYFMFHHNNSTCKQLQELTWLLKWQLFNHKRPPMTNSSHLN